jgi:putrescine transport system permease protein
MNTTWSRFNIASMVLGFAFLYLPIVILVIFSFNASKLVTVWGGFSTQWYGSLFRNQGFMDAAWVTSASAFCRPPSRPYPGHNGGAGAGPLYALSGPGPVLGHGVCAAGHAGGHHRPVAAAAVRRRRLDRGFVTVTLAHITFTMCFVAVVVQSRLVTFDRSLEEAAMDLGATPEHFSDLLRR